MVTFGDDRWTGEAVFFTVGDYKAPNANNNSVTELRFYIPPDTKWVLSEKFFPANLLA